MQFKISISDKNIYFNDNSVLIKFIQEMCFNASNTTAELHRLNGKH